MVGVLCITAFKEINRGEWADKGVLHSRSTEDYLNWFVNLSKLNITLICFCDEPIASEIRSRSSFKNIFPYDESDTFFKYINTETMIMNSPYYKRIVGSSSLPEHSVPEYNIVNHSKVNFIRRAYEMNPGYSHYAWIDFGFQRSPPTETPVWRHTLNDRINYAVHRYFSYDEIPDPESICNDPEKGNIVQGSFFVVPNHLVKWYENAYEKALKYYYSRNLSDDDQSIVLLCIKNDPDKFNLHVRGWMRLLFE
jgi:hypothetical protein